MPYYCQGCGYSSQNLDQANQQFVKQMQQRGLKMLMLTCPQCQTTQAYLENDVNETPTEPAIPCPIKGCSGLVCHILNQDEDFWGCGSCRNVWRDKPDFAR